MAFSCVGSRNYVCMGFYFFTFGSPPDFLLDDKATSCGA